MFRKYPFHDREPIISFDPRTYEYEKDRRSSARPRGEGEPSALEGAVPVIALIDGEHHPPAVRDALDALDAERGLAGVVFCGGEEKVRAGVLADPAAHYGRAVVNGPAAAAALRRWRSRGRGGGGPRRRAGARRRPQRLRAGGPARCTSASPTRRPACGSTPPRLRALDFDGPNLAVIGTGKRTGKTAVAGHWAGLLRDAGGSGDRVHGARRPGRAAGRPRRASGSTSCSRSRARAATPRRTTSRTRCWPGCGPSAAGAWAAGWRGSRSSRTWSRARRWPPRSRPGALVLEGSGACIPPVRGGPRPCASSAARARRGARPLPRAARRPRACSPADAPAERPGASRCELRPEPAEPCPRARAWRCSPPGAGACRGRRAGRSPRTNLARRRRSRRTSTRRRRGLRRLPDRAQGGGDRHRGRARRGARAPGSSSCATARSASTATSTPRCWSWRDGLRRSSSTAATACPTRRA